MLWLHPERNQIMIRLTPLLTDHAVVQRRQGVPVWGWTDRLRTRLGAARVHRIETVRNIHAEETRYGM